MRVTAGHMAPTLEEPDPSQSRGNAWDRARDGRIRFYPKRSPALTSEICPTDTISNRSGGDPLVITPWLTNHNRDLATSLGLVNPRAGPQLRA